MSAFRFYLSIPLDNGQYSEFEEITEDVLENSVGNLKQNLSSNEYDIGTIKFNKISVNLRNEKAKYSQANNPLSIFTTKRDESILKIMWDVNEDTIACGNFACGHTYLSHPVEVYKGFLEDNSSKFDADTQVQTFNFLGLESIIGKVGVNYSSLSVSDDMLTTIYNLLNQEKITKFLTVDPGNISVAHNFVPDNIESLQNKKVLDALDEILFLCGAVLYVENDTIYVSTRDASPTSKFIFYGPSSDLGIENLIDVSSYTLGLNRTFNSWRWKDTAIVQSFADSIDANGFRDKEVDSELVTNTTKRTNILTSLLAEYGFPKIELEIKVPMTTPIISELFLLDRINIDYPADYRGNEDDELPATYGKAIYGRSSYIQAVSSLIIDVGIDWKILNRNISIKDHIITFKIREV